MYEVRLKQVIDGKQVQEVVSDEIALIDAITLARKVGGYITFFGDKIWPFDINELRAEMRNKDLSQVV